MDLPNRIKSAGYAVSTLSVLLLAVPAWKTASTDPLVAACLLAGMASSIAGMALRWWSYQVQKAREDRGGSG